MLNKLYKMRNNGKCILWSCLLLPMQYVKSSNVMVFWLPLMFSVQAVPSLILIQGHFSQLIILRFLLVPTKDNALEMDHNHIPLHHTNPCWWSWEHVTTSSQDSLVGVSGMPFLMSTFNVHRHRAIKWQWHRNILVLTAVTSGILWIKIRKQKSYKNVTALTLKLNTISKENKSNLLFFFFTSCGTITKNKLIPMTHNKITIHGNLSIS